MYVLKNLLIYGHVNTKIHSKGYKIIVKLISLSITVHGSVSTKNILKCLIKYKKDFKLYKFKKKNLVNTITKTHY